MAAPNASIPGVVQLPNTFTATDLLPSEVAYQVTISTYIIVGSMGVCHIMRSFFPV